MSYPARQWADVPAAVAALHPRAVAAAEAAERPGPLWWNPATDAVRPVPGDPSRTLRIKAAGPESGPERWSPLQRLEEFSATLGRPLGGPNALTHALVGAGLGAGIGGGLGWALDRILPGRFFRKDRARRAGFLLGGLAGAAPGLIGGAGRAGVPGAGAIPGTAGLAGLPEAGSTWMARFLSPYGWRDPGKAAAALDAGGDAWRTPIPVDAFNRVIWEDVPGGATAPEDAALVSGVVAATGAREGRGVVGPWEVATTVAGGLGRGYGAGLLVGETLGALAGLKPEYRASLRRAGLWGGLIGGVAQAIAAPDS